MAGNNYSDIRQTIKSGDVLGFSHTGWLSWHSLKIQIVRLFTRSLFSHVGTAFVLGGRVFCIEAVEPMVRIYPLSKLGDFYWSPMDSPWTEDTTTLALSYIGDDYKQLTALKAFFKELPKDCTNECAALVQAINNSMGVSLGNRATPDSVIQEAQMLGKPIWFIKNETT